MTKEKKEGDSLSWVVEKQVAALAVAVAESHAKRGNEVVMLTSRRIHGQDLDVLDGYGVKVVSTRGER